MRSSISVAWFLLASALSAGPLEFGRAELNAALSERGLAPETLRLSTEVSADLPETFRIERNRVLGGDLRGLMYGLLEAADQIRTHGKLSPVQSKPAVVIRGIRVSLNAEKGLESEQEWLAFVRRLARERFNRLNLVLVQRVAESRLQFMSQSAAEHGLDVTLGLREHTAITAPALARILQGCPAIRAVQIAHESEIEFVVEGIREAGRLIQLELRGSLTQTRFAETARNHGIPVRMLVSHHHTQPYPAPDAPGSPVLGRVSAAAPPENLILPMLKLFPKQPHRVRPYDLIWEISPASDLVWGDAEFVRRALTTVALADAQGFEIEAPPRPTRDSNWLFYSLWGRVGYDPTTTDEVWKQEAQRRYGSAAADVLQTYRLASRIQRELGRFLAIGPKHGGSIESYRESQPLDSAFMVSVREAVFNRVQRIASAKQTPSQTAAKLNAMAAALDEASSRAGKLDSGVAADFRSASVLARYHASKLLAADELQAAYMTGGGEGLQAAKRHLISAAASWKILAEATPDHRYKEALPVVEQDIKTIEERIKLYDKFGAFDHGFDFGDDASQRTGTVEPRFRPVAADTMFDESRGFGWVTKAERKMQELPADRPPSDTLYGDSVRGSGEQVFRVKAAPGEYSVHILRPDESEIRSSIKSDSGILDVTTPSGWWSICGIIITREGAGKSPTPQVWPETLARPQFDHVAPPVFIPGQALTCISHHSGGRRGRADFRDRFLPIVLVQELGRRTT